MDCKRKISKYSSDILLAKFIDLVLNSKSNRSTFKNIKNFRFWQGKSVKGLDSQLKLELYENDDKDQATHLIKNRNSFHLEKKKPNFIQFYSQRRLKLRLKEVNTLRKTMNPTPIEERMEMSPEEIELAGSSNFPMTEIPAQYEELSDKIMKGAASNENLRRNKTDIRSHFLAGRLGIDAWLAAFSVLGILLIPLYFYSRLVTKQNRRKKDGLDPEILKNPEKYGYDLDEVSPQYIFNDEVDVKRDRMREQRRRIRQKIDEASGQL